MCAVVYYDYLELRYEDITEKGEHTMDQGGYLALLAQQPMKTNFRTC